MNLITLLKQIFFLLALLTGSFILIHFLALFGLFLTLAIPILHLFFYPHILCFWCRLTHTHHTFRHSVIDSFLMLILTLLSASIVYGEYQLISKFTSPEIPRIAEFSIPTKNQYQVAEIFPFPIELERIPTSINAFQADVSFDPQLLEVVDLTTDGTFASFFVQKEYDNEKGYIRLSGGVPNPGYRQASGILGTAYFRGKAPGATQLIYLDTSLVLANDGRGTNLLSDYPKIPLIILPNTEPTSSNPGSVTIRTQVQGDTDKTVLSFTEYAHALPKPYANVQGSATRSAAVVPPAPKPTLPIALLYSLDQRIISFWSWLFPSPTTD